MTKDKAEFEKITSRQDMSNYVINRKGELKNVKTGLKLVGSIDPKGYRQYMVTLDGGKKTVVKAHQLVARQYIPRVKGKEFVNHKDEDKANCDVDNLEWMTPKENANHATCQKRRAENRKQVVNEYDVDGRYIRTWNSGMDVEDYARNVLKSTLGCADGIYNCCNRKTYVSLGRIWRYYDGDTDDLALTYFDLPSKIKWRKDWDDFVNAKDIPEKYLYKPLSVEDVMDYFLGHTMLSEREKLMLKETFSKIPQK